jgi:endo-1,4-beta-xylanase
MTIMNPRILFFGSLFILAAGVLGSCKRQVIGIGSLGNYKDTGSNLKDATDVPLGVAVDYTPTLNDPAYLNLIKRDFDGVTFSYQMKHGAIVQGNGSLNFTQADAMVSALSGLQIYGHTLGWHQNQNESYLESYAGIVQAAPTNLILNGGFESGSGSSFTNWSAFNGASSFSAGAAPN